MIDEILGGKFHEEIARILLITNSYATGEVGDGWVKSWGGGIQSLVRRKG